MALTNGLKLIVQTRVQDKLCSFGLAFLAGASLDNASTQALCNSWWAANGEAYLDILAEDVSFEGLYCHALEPGVVLPHRTPGLSQPGTRPGNSSPANSCLVVTLQTDDPAAVRQGRIYISGLSKNDLLEGLWDPTFMATEVDLFVELLDETVVGGGGSFIPSFVQRVVAGVPIPGNLFDVTNARASSIPYSQRRRTTRQLGFGVTP